MNLYSVEYERLLLGAILQDNTLIEECDLQGQHFYKPFHQTAWREIKALVGKGAVADQSTLYPIIGADVFDLDAPTTANFAYYAEQVKELFLRRRVHVLSVNTQELAMSAPSGALIAKIEQELVSIASDGKVGYQRASEAVHGVVQIVEQAFNRKGEYSGIPTKVRGLDRMLDGLQNEEFTIIGARPGSGKTAFALHIADAACAGKYRVGFFSAEMSAQLLLRRLLSKESAVAQWKLRAGALSREDLDKITDAAGHIYERNLYIDDTPNISLDRLLSSARRMKRREEVDLIIVDYIGLVTHPNQTLPRHEQVREISKALKGLARELAVPVIALSQLTRDTEGKRPTLASIRDSGALEQDADVVMFLWPREERAENTRLVTLILEKQRNGPVGTLDLVFDTARMRFTEVMGGTQ